MPNVTLDKNAVSPEVNALDLTLYVAGRSAKSIAALANLKEICEEHVCGNYRIDVIDLQEHPRLASEDQIFAIPTLVRRIPLPVRKIIGDLSNTKKVVLELELALGNDGDRS